MPSKSNGRRSFVHRLTALAAGIAATTLGIVPEARSASLATPAPAPGGPTSAPLATEVQNALYSAALNDPSVALLLATLPTAGRLDPPQESGETFFDTGAHTQTVVMPVASYADGSPLAYVFYGNDTTNLLHMSTIVTSDGKVQLSIGGQIYDSAAPDWNAVYFAAYFPTQYHAKVVAPQITALNDSKGSRPSRRFASLTSLFVTRTALAEAAQGNAVAVGGKPDCIQTCTDNWKLCVKATLLVLGVGSLMIAAWCMLCATLVLIAVATGVGVTVGAPVLPVLMAKCAYACYFSIGALLTLIATLKACDGVEVLCLKNCNLLFPPAPPPGGGPGPVVANPVAL